MKKPLGTNSRLRNSLSSLLALFLSAALGLGFVALVNKTHELLAPARFEGQNVVRR
ncbi:MAG: hypothetical protein JWM21_147 [Acidobacteria bacterium]|nr:hypothetical protein [Acidobacteriota bacterium]